MKTEAWKAVLLGLMIGITGGVRAKSDTKSGLKEKRTMRVHDACHKCILLEKCLSLVHQAVNASS